MATVRPISSSSASDMVRAEPALVPASTYSPVRPPMRLPREMLEPPEPPPLEQPAMRMRERRRNVFCMVGLLVRNILLAQARHPESLTGLRAHPHGMKG